MKSAEELFDKIHCLESDYFLNKYTMNFFIHTRTEIIKILAKHDKEIIQMIDEMVKARKRGIVLLQSLPLQNPPQISTDEWILALTELKQKLEKK